MNINITKKNKIDKVSYPLDLQINFKKINIIKESKVFCCIYRINKNNNKSFLEYLLYKYSTPDIFIFPFKKINPNQNPLKTANKLSIDLTNSDMKCGGYLQFNNNFYFFYENKETHAFEHKKRSDTLWWVLIDEICNHNKILNFPIHKSTYKLFYINPSLIYLKLNKKKIQIPVAAYYGDTLELIPYVSSLGLRANTLRLFGPYYYFSSYIKAFAWGGWTSNYKPRYILDKKITDDNGKYKQGGVIRWALFLDNCYVLLYQKNNLFYDLIHDLNNAYKNKKKGKILKHGVSKWTDKYDSLFLGNIKYKNLSGFFNINPEIVLKDFNQQISLTSHNIDTKTLKHNWDPNYKNYLIQ
jgi:hypothetical protein